MPPCRPAVVERDERVLVAIGDVGGVDACGRAQITQDVAGGLLLV
jgi:hypothetical protein